MDQKINRSLQLNQNQTKGMAARFSLQYKATIYEDL